MRKNNKCKNNHTLTPENTFIYRVNCVGCGRPFEPKEELLTTNNISNKLAEEEVVEKKFNFCGMEIKTDPTMKPGEWKVEKGVITSNPPLEVKENFTDDTVEAIKSMYSKMRKELDKQEEQAITQAKKHGITIGLPPTEVKEGSKDIEWEKVIKEDLLNYIHDIENRNWEVMEEQILKAEMAWNNLLSQQEAKITEETKEFYYRRGYLDAEAKIKRELAQKLKEICNKSRTERGLATAIGNYIKLLSE